jgi:hypothetical protein
MNVIANWYHVVNMSTYRCEYVNFVLLRGFFELSAGELTKGRRAIPM